MFSSPMERPVGEETGLPMTTRVSLEADPSAPVKSAKITDPADSWIIIS